MSHEITWFNRLMASALVIGSVGFALMLLGAGAMACVLAFSALRNLL